VKVPSDIRALRYERFGLRYQGLIGTGGIGSGRFFLMSGNHTLGREESRSGRLLDVKDYCKQHIVLHYVKTLLGPEFPVMPIGKLGDDETGHILYREMEETGFIMDLVHRVPHLPTLFSFCFQYPDGSGGNMTTEESASAQVDPAFINSAAHKIEEFGTRAMIVAVPEVPLAARKTLLSVGKQRGLFCSASFTSGEIRDAMDTGVLENVDLIALNTDEAATISGEHPERQDPSSVAGSAIRVLHMHHRNMKVAITAGDQGSWCWDGYRINRFSAAKVKAMNTAGAGDAFFSGLLCGLVLGMHLFDAQQLATLVAGLSVTSPHTIHHGLDRKSLQIFMPQSGLTFSDAVIRLMEDPGNP